MVYMDFSKDIMDRQEHGTYEYLPMASLPRLWLAYVSDPSDSGSLFYLLDSCNSSSSRLSPLRGSAAKRSNIVRSAKDQNGVLLSIEGASSSN